MREFSHTAVASRIVFATGAAAQVGDELARLGHARALVICSPRAGARAAPVVAGLGARHAATFDAVAAHVPIAAVAAAEHAARAAAADCLVPVGGGAALDLAKAVAVASDCAIVAVPTTYSGAEVTPLYGVTGRAGKAGHQDPRAYAATVVYDPALTTGLSAHTTATTGMNALAHCVEALYAANADPIARRLAEDGAQALARGLPASVAAPDDLTARAEALYGAFLGGLVVAMVGIAIHHRICHVLGGRFGLAHGDANAAILPHATAYNAEAAPDAMAALGARAWRRPRRRRAGRRHPRPCRRDGRADLAGRPRHAGGGPRRGRRNSRR